MEHLYFSIFQLFNTFYHSSGLPFCHMTLKQAYTGNLTKRFINQGIQRNSDLSCTIMKYTEEHATRHPRA